MEKLFYLTLNLPLSYIFGLVGILLFFYMLLCSFVSIAKKRADLADIAWGPGFVVVAWASLILGQATTEGFIVNILVTIWAIRLAFHLYMRNRKRDEDFRYQKLQIHNNFNLFTKVFLLQGCILYVISLPIIWIHTHPQDLIEQTLYIALPLWLVGFGLETIADLQLSFFKKDPSNKGKLLTVGLWSFVRHPNYLGELIQWWAIWLIAAFLPFGWALIISPTLLTLLIINISGIKPLEEKIHKHAELKTYLEKTPSLIPPSLVNGALYGLTWFFLVAYGAERPSLISTTLALGCYAAQLWLFAKFDKTSLRICVPLSIIALGLGVLQEMILIQLEIITYPNHGAFPPLWILALYPLFSLTLNSSLAFLNKSLTLAFFLGGFGALSSYLFGERLSQVQLLAPTAYFTIFLFWGTFLTVLIIINRILKRRFF